MFERFTDRARNALVGAQIEARELDHNFLGTEHIVLGLFRAGGVAATVLNDAGVTEAVVRERIRSIVGAGAEIPTEAPVFTPRARKVLELALREALQLGHNYIGTEHLLLAVVREGQGLGAQIVAERLPLRELRQKVIEALSAIGPAPRAGESRRGGRVAPRRRRQPEDVLLSLFDEPESRATKALALLGLDREKIEAALAAVPEESKEASDVAAELDLGEGVQLRLTTQGMTSLLESESMDPLRSVLIQRLGAAVQEAAEPPEANAEADEGGDVQESD